MAGESSQAGFTLIEILVAVAVTALILTGISGVFFTVQAARERAWEDAESTHLARVLLDRMGREIRSAVVKPRDERTRFSGGTEDTGLGYLDLTTFSGGPPSGAQDALTILSYRLESGGAGELPRRLLIREQKSFWDEGGQDERGTVVSRRVQSFTLQFYDGSQWIDSWDSVVQGRLPRGVEISLVVSAGDRKMPFRTVIDMPLGGGMP